MNLTFFILTSLYNFKKLKIINLTLVVFGFFFYYLYLLKFQLFKKKLIDNINILKFVYICKYYFSNIKSFKNIIYNFI